MTNETRFETWMTWAGRLLSLAPVLILLMSARWKLTHDPWYAGEWGRIGYKPGAINGIGFVQVACVLLYVIPQTAVLGTVLLTGTWAVPSRVTCESENPTRCSSR